MFFSSFKDTIKACFYHSHKKRNDSLETRAELAVLCTYVENQAIIEPILLYRASKYQKKTFREEMAVLKFLEYPKRSPTEKL